MAVQTWALSVTMGVMRPCYLVILFPLAILLLMQCDESPASTDTETEAGLESTGAVVSVLFGSLSSAENLSANRLFKNLDSSMEICNNLDAGPTKVMMSPWSREGSYGSGSDSIAVVASDFCENEDETENTAPANDGGELFASFTLLDTIAGNCGSSTVSITRGSGIIRNTDAFMPEIYGQFEIGGEIAYCALRLDGDGNINSADSNCTDGTGTEITMTSTLTCDLESNVDRIALPSAIEGHYAISATDEDTNAIYDCYAINPMDRDSDGFNTITSDCTTFEDYGFNLEGLNIGVVVGGDNSTWEIYVTTDLEQTANWIKILHNEGYPVIASVDMLYVESFTGSNYDAIADGANFPSDLLANPTFESELTEQILEIAEYIEALNVEVFSPLSEPDRVWNSASTASTYLQNILSDVQDRFSGYLMWIGQFFDNTDSSTYNLRGYDYAAVNISPMPGQDDTEFQIHVTTQLTNLKTLADNLGIPYLISNAGLWGEALTSAEYDWNLDSTRVLNAFTIMKSTSDTLGTAGIIFWEGTTGEVVFADYADLSQFIATEFGGNSTAF